MVSWSSEDRYGYWEHENEDEDKYNLHFICHIEFEQQTDRQHQQSYSNEGHNETNQSTDPPFREQTDSGVFCPFSLFFLDFGHEDSL